MIQYHPIWTLLLRSFHLCKGMLDWSPRLSQGTKSNFPWSGALIIIKVVGPFCQRHNYKNPVEEGTQPNVCWDLNYAGIGPITKGAVQRDDPYHHRHCASPPVATALHCSDDLHLHRRVSSSTSTAYGVSALSLSSLSNSCTWEPLFYPKVK